MRLASFRRAADSGIRLGVSLEIDGCEWLLDLAALGKAGSEPLPSTMIALLSGGAPMLERVRQAAERFAQTSFASPVAETTHGDLLIAAADAVFLPPIPRPGKVISIGANYRAHVDEIDPAIAPKALGELPRSPPAFSKFPSALAGHRAVIPYPANTEALDYEIELAVIIGQTCKNVPLERWREVVAGYTIFNDVSMRDVQLQEMKSGSLCMGKNADGSGPLGPYLVTADEVADPMDLRLSLTVNEEVRQEDSTRRMIFSIGEIIAYWSRITLEPGDVITTGSPGGIGYFREPRERYLLKPGDRIKATIEGLGSLENAVGN